MDGLQGLCVVARLIVGHLIPGEVVAVGLVELGCVGVVDGEVEGDHGVASNGVGEGDGRCVGALVVGDAVDPGEGVAGHVRVCGGGGVVDDQVEGDGGVAAVDAGELLGVLAGLGVGYVVPGERLAGGVAPDGGGVVPQRQM